MGHPRGTPQNPRSGPHVYLPPALREGFMAQQSRYEAASLQVYPQVYPQVDVCYPQVSTHPRGY